MLKMKCSKIRKILFILILNVNNVSFNINTSCDRSISTLWMTSNSLFLEHSRIRVTKVLTTLIFVSVLMEFLTLDAKNNHIEWKGWIIYYTQSNIHTHTCIRDRDDYRVIKTEFLLLRTYQALLERFYFSSYRSMIIIIVVFAYFKLIG